MTKRFCIVFIFCLLVSWNTFAQNDDEDTLKKPTLVTFEGQPSLKFETGKDYSAFAIIKKYENEDAFMFFVTHNANKKEITDFLYITRTRVIYESPNNEKRSFVYLRSNIKKADFDKIGLANSVYFFFIKTDDEVKRFNIKFTPRPSKFQLFGKAQKPVFEFIISLIEDFDAASKPYLEQSNNTK